MAFLVNHEMSGTQIQIPPRVNFLFKTQTYLKIDIIATAPSLYGVRDVIEMLRYNGMDHQIPELFFILGKQAASIKQKLESRDAEFRKKHFLDVIITKNRNSRYSIRSISIENLLSYRLQRGILVKLVPAVKSIMTFINKKREEINTFTTDDDYEKILGIKDEIQGMIDSFYSNIIFTLPKEEQDEYLCISFQDDKINSYITDVVNEIRGRYNTYYNSQRIMLVEDEDTPHFKRLKEGTILYRGYANGARRRFIPPGRPFVFFTPNPFVALGYAKPADEGDDLGEIAVYQTSPPLKLLDFSNYRTVSYIYAKLNELGAPRNVIDSLLYGWFGWEGWFSYDGVDSRQAHHRPFTGPTPSEETFKRKSDQDVDFEVVKWICEQGFNGYVALNVNGLADEIVLCEPIPLDEAKPKKISQIGVLDKSFINYPLPSSEEEWYENILKTL